MYAEAVRLTRDALEDATIGINAMLDTLSYFAGDTAPADIATFGDEVRTERVALGEMPAPLPSLAVTVEQFRQLGDGISTDQGHGSATLLVRIAVADLDAREAKRDASYYLRAAMWSLRKFARREAGHASRAQNSVSLLVMGEIEAAPMYDPLEDARLIAALRVTWTLHDYGSF